MAFGNLRSSVVDGFNVVRNNDICVQMTLVFEMVIILRYLGT